MTDQIREQLSALLDGELPRDEMDLLMRRLEKDPELRRTFGSYALIGETLRAPGGRIAAPSFAARVTAAIEDAPAIVEKSSTARPVSTSQRPQHVALWRRPMVRTALAASAAATAVLLFRPDVTPVAQLEVTPANSFAMSASPTRRRASASRATWLPTASSRHRWSVATCFRACSRPIPASLASRTRWERLPDNEWSRDEASRRLRRCLPAGVFGARRG